MAKRETQVGFSMGEVAGEKKWRTKKTTSFGGKNDGREHTEAPTLWFAHQEKGGHG